MPVCLYVPCPPVCLSVCQFVCPYLLVYPSVCLSVCPYVNLPVCLSACLSVSRSPYHVGLNRCMHICVEDVSDCEMETRDVGGGIEPLVCYSPGTVSPLSQWPRFFKDVKKLIKKSNISTQAQKFTKVFLHQCMGEKNSGSRRKW